MAAVDLSLDTGRAKELATTLGNAESDMATVFEGETGDAGVTLPGTNIPNVATTALTKVSKASRTLISEYEALSTGTSTSVIEFENQDTTTASGIAANQGALA
ncbi:hypothetical protein [Nocardia rosealba]|uniref:hypothetical protein n=1 Tax=Nocardia TaxID=1817 RepID=UPI001CD972CA|nr:hypothetical protein [Nocardia rosealba]MCA2209353.1 hypothetical protein [Nocardia rosealba]